MEESRRFRVNSNERFAIFCAFLAAAFCLGPAPSWGQEALLFAPKPDRIAFTSLKKNFTCEIPKGWPSFEEETLQGSSVHFMGPSEADGAFRAAIHVHFVQKDRPGFISLEEAVKRERRSDKDTHRDASPITFGRLAKNQSRRFEVTETRQLPRETLPSRPVVLHHYYVFVSGSDGYYIIKMSTTRETYLAYRPGFERLLATFQTLGYQ